MSQTETTQTETGPKPLRDVVETGAITRRDSQAAAAMLAEPASTQRPDTKPCEECDVRGVKGYAGQTELYCDCEHGKARHLRYLRQTHDQFDHAGAPDHLKGVTLESLREKAGEAVMNSEAVATTRDLLEDGVATDPKHRTQHQGICILGPNGRGKTGLLVILARRAYEQGFTPLFIKYSDYYSSVQNGYGRYADADPRHDLSQIRIESAQRASHLCLDDLGDPFGKASEYQVPKDRRDILFRTLSARHERGRPTYITANYTNLGQIAEQFDPRVADRIKEMCAVVRLDGPNLREIE